MGETTDAGSSSTGAPPLDVCDDGVCGELEATAACWGEGFCAADCWALPECEPDCPCAPEAAQASNFCGLPPGTCSATMPGGYCDPNGDGSYGDADWSLGFAQWVAKCGA